ncbi:MAG: DUF2147 domain-containing protein [Erythrobacter sp.]|nr:DUF2147 domain-containing protein [Erythrobacter sp.]MBA4081229.1 DUF2147 domain-containing protein [Erythrobacter sp.]
MTRKGVMAAVLGAGLGLAALVPAAFAAEPITGRWVTAEKDAVIVIAPCGKALCGTIERFLVAPPQGNDQRDINNPDAAKRKRKLLATTPILSAFTQESNLWRGQIYDPKSGKSYRSVVRRKGPNLLEVKGCIGPFCQTQLWRRAV